MMKKNIFFLAIAFIATMAKAQTTEFDAVNLSQTDIRGNARYMGMAGAFGALGGNSSAIKDNPAGLSIYRSSELGITCSLLQQRTNTFFGGNKKPDDLRKFQFDEFSYVLSSYTGRRKGLIYSNWNVSIKKTVDFNRNISARGSNTSMIEQVAALATQSRRDKNYFSQSNETLFNDIDAPSYLSIMAQKSGLIEYDSGQKRWQPVLSGNLINDFTYNLSERGSVSSLNLNWAGNIDNTLYIGLGLNHETISYSKELFYKEFASDPNFNFKLRTAASTYGHGFNFNVGLIYRPIDPLRLGISYISTTTYNLRDELTETSIDNIYAEDEFYDYKLRTPGKLNLSAAYIFGKKAVLSTDFIYSSCFDIKLSEPRGYQGDYRVENQIMHGFNKSFTIKTGFEYLLSDNWFARAGFAHIGFFSDSNSIMPTNRKKTPWIGTKRADLDYMVRTSTNFFTGGIGYRAKYWSLDFACVSKNFGEYFSPSDAINSKQGKIKTTNLDFIGTFSLRF